jgi:hypothetical protein
MHKRMTSFDYRGFAFAQEPGQTPQITDNTEKIVKEPVLFSKMETLINE